MRNNYLKIVSILLALLMIFQIMPATEVWAVSESQFDSKMSELKGQYPNYSCWNDRFDNGSECWGFANMLGYKVFGTKPSTWKKVYSINNVKKGDLIQYGSTNGSGHTVFVTSVSGDTITFVDCNGNGNYSGANKVRHNGVLWGNTIKKGNKMYGRINFSYICVSPGFDNPNPPTYSNFWVDHYLFDLSETVSFTAVASGADNYTIGIDKTGVGRVVTEGCGSTYTISADRLGAGEYSAYMTVANSAGYVDTYRVYFVVVEKCNFGDKFSARIQNIGTGCYITNKDSKIVGAPESGYNDQIWFFNKCSDGSYTIMSQLDGLMMDDEWDSDVPAGADIRAWSATGQDKQRFNIYYMDDAFYIRPANTKTLVVDMGAGEPYNVACYNLLRNAGQQKYRFDMVGMGDYIPYGLGDEFYAQLRCQGTNLYVTNQSGNVAGAAATADDSQIWKFMRQSNGAYVIQNTLDGSYIAVENSNDANKTNFLSYNEYTGNRNQQFYFYEMDNAFYIKPLI